MSKTPNAEKLAALLREALEIYEQLMATADGPINRENWKVDRDDVERAMIYAEQVGNN